MRFSVTCLVIACFVQLGLPAHASAAPVNGQCGPANETYTSVAPTVGLCSAGTASSVNGNGPWLWSCAGTGGGTMALCAASPPIFPLAANGRHLIDQNGKPFLVVGDAPQAIINIPLTGTDSMDTYFPDRYANGFNALWVNLICASYTACPSDGTTYDGIAPFTGTLSGNGCPAAGLPECYDLTTPNPTYFTRMDAIIRKAGSYGLVLFLDPASTDGCAGDGWMQTLINNGSTRANSYGTFLGNRYKNFPNIIWMSGNDFQCYTTTSDDNLAAAIVSGMQSAGDTHLQTAELSYTVSSTKDDTGALGTLADLNAAYTYSPTYDEVRHAYNQASIPVYMVEANYEYEDLAGEPNTGMGVSMLVLRKQEYWTMLSGATGQLYGNHYTWTFASGWPSFLDTTGATQLHYMKNFFAALPWSDLIPDQNETIMTAGFGTYTGGGTITANTYATTASASNADGTLVVAYIPTVRAVTIDMTQLGPQIQARWYDPTTGNYSVISGSPFANTGARAFTPPGNNTAGDGDWVLLLQGETIDTIFANGFDNTSI